MQFTKLAGSIVITSNHGVQHQHEAWHRKGDVFIKVGSGFIGLRQEGTSVLKRNLVDYDLGSQEQFAFTKTGRMVLKSHPDAHYKCSGIYDEDRERELLKAPRKTRPKKK